MSNVIEFRKKDEGSNPSSFIETVRKYYEGKGESQDVVKYAVQRAEKYKSTRDNDVLFRIDLTLFESEKDAKNIYDQMQAGIESICKSYNDELLQLKVKLVGEEVKVYKLKADNKAV